MDSIEIYQPNVVLGIKNYYGHLLYNYAEGDTIKSRLEKLGAALWHAYKANNSVVRNEINNYHPNFLSRTWEAIKASNFREADAYIAVAAQYGYSNWDDVPNDEIDIVFEKAIDALLNGDLRQLNEYFILDPSLATKKSQYGHGAALIHYVGSNGFELYRQVVPMNLPLLLDYLVKAGCDLNAKMNVYGGQFEMIELLNTSAHPKAAGILEEVVGTYHRFIQ